MSIVFMKKWGKSIGYLEVVENKLIYITGSGILLFTDTKNILDTTNLKFQHIKNNLQERIKIVMFLIQMDGKVLRIF